MAHPTWAVSKEVSFAYPHNGRLVLCMADGVYHLDPESGEETPIALLDLPKGHRLNDGKLDLQGRLWVGTINTADDPSPTAALYVLRGAHLEEFEGGLPQREWQGLVLGRTCHVSRGHGPKHDLAIRL